MLKFDTLVDWINTWEWFHFFENFPFCFGAA